MEIKFQRTRLAPTPSGFLHLGNVLSFALTAALARKAGARIFLRIDDMDRDRVEPMYVQDVFDTLNFLELPWDEGPKDAIEFERHFSQRSRMELYEEGLRQLIESGKVFACSCSRAEILRMSADGVYPGTCRDRVIKTRVDGESWRLRTGEEEVEVRELGVGFGVKRGNLDEYPRSRSPIRAEGDVMSKVDEWRVDPMGMSGAESNLSGDVKAGDELVFTRRERLPDAVKDFVVRKKDGFPAYQLTSVIDDLYYEVDLVVRGKDLWPSTLAQHYLASAGGMDLGRVTFFHHPLLLGTSGVKLSKSAGDTSVRYLRGEGLKKEDVFMRLGGLLGLKQPVGRWEELAKVLLG